MKSQSNRWFLPDTGEHWKLRWFIRFYFPLGVSCARGFTVSIIFRIMCGSLFRFCPQRGPATSKETKGKKKKKKENNKDLGLLKKK
jgi:hypothetical protein